MSSKIEWTGSTWNPIAGCSILTAGCTNCYAMSMARRLERMGVDKYKGLTRQSGDRTIWTGAIREDPDTLSIPLRWKKARTIFVNSMSDLFHEAISDAFRLSVWAIMMQTPRHTYQILTKRPETMAQFIRNNAIAPLPNVWLGTSVENHETAGRIDVLRHIPAAVRFLSCEPLLGPLGPLDLSGINWLIAGGESGPKARPMQKEWVEDLQRTCEAQSCAFFFKQWGTWGPDGIRRSARSNGRMLNGQTWDAMPL